MTLENQRLSAQTYVARAGGARVARPHPGGGGRRAPAHRARSARRRAAAARGAAHQARARRRATDDGHANGAEGAATLRRLGDDVEDALEEVRSLARGIYPAALADRGLVEGLRAAALRSPLPTKVNATGIQRHSARDRERRLLLLPGGAPERGQARGGRAAGEISLWADGSLRLEVRDDGAGFDPAAVAEGSGFTNMRDRLAAVGGELVIISSRGHGTRVMATISPRRSRSLTFDAVVSMAHITAQAASSHR